MTNRNLFLFFLTTMSFLIRPIWAQEPAQQEQQSQQSQQSSGSGSNGGYYVFEQRYVQIIEWIGDDFTLKYEVVIEKNEGGGYIAYSREFTEKPNLQISLPLGKYRYRIIPYDYLEHPGEASEWVNIDVDPSPAAVTNETGSPINLYVSAAWTPLFSLFGRMHEILGNDFYPVGASVRFGALYNKLQWFNPGIELSMSWFSLNSAQSKDTMGIKTGVTGFNIVAQKPLSGRIAVTLKTGAAILFQVSEINIEDYSYWTGGLIPQINLEASFLWFAYKQLFLEAGIGFYYLLNKEGNSGCLNPRIGVGWQF